MFNSTWQTAFTIFVIIGELSGTLCPLCSNNIEMCCTMSGTENPSVNSAIS